MALTFFIDTNIFLELEFQDRRWQECRDLLNKLESGEIRAFTTDYVVYSSILEIESKQPRKAEAKIGIFLAALSALKGLSILRPSTNEMAYAVELMRRKRLDFDDSYVVASMKAEGVKTLISFDRHFDKQNEIERKEPIQILEVMESEKLRTREMSDSSSHDNRNSED